MAEKIIHDNGYTFTVDDNGTVSAKGIVHADPASRSGMASIHPDGYDSSLHDKGHLIAAKEGGPAAEYNVSAQDRHLNRSNYKTLENAEVRLANEGNTVETEKIAYSSRSGKAPDAYMVNDTITTPDGRTVTVHHSFQNASPGDQEKWNNLADQYSDYDDNYNPYEGYMSKEDYNEMMETTEGELSNLRDDYDMDSVSSMQFQGEAGALPDPEEEGGQDEDFDPEEEAGALPEAEDETARDFSPVSTKETDIGLDNMPTLSDDGLEY